MVRILTPLLVFTTLAVGFANPISKRDTNQDLAAIHMQFIAINNSVTEFPSNNNADSFWAMLSEFQDLDSALKTSTDNLAGNTTLSQSDADMAIGHLYRMQQCALDGMSKLIDIKPSVEACSVSRALELVRQNIIQMHYSYTEWADILAESVPANRQEECQEITAPMKKLYGEATTAYEG